MNPSPKEKTSMCKEVQSRHLEEGSSSVWLPSTPSWPTEGSWKEQKGLSAYSNHEILSLKISPSTICKGIRREARVKVRARRWVLLDKATDYTPAHLDWLALLPKAQITHTKESSSLQPGKTALPLDPQALYQPPSPSTLFYTILNKIK